jgi:hypothetical protein
MTVKVNDKKYNIHSSLLVRSGIFSELLKDIEEEGYNHSSIAFDQEEKVFIFKNLSNKSFEDFLLYIYGINYKNERINVDLFMFLLDVGMETVAYNILFNTNEYLPVEDFELIYLEFKKKNYLNQNYFHRIFKKLLIIFKYSFHKYNKLKKLDKDVQIEIAMLDYKDVKSYKTPDCKSDLNLHIRGNHSYL